MRKTLFAAISAVAVFPPMAPAQERFVEFEFRYWLPQMSGHLRVESSAIGTDIDTHKDLGMPDTKFPQGRVTFQGMGRSRLQFTYTPIDVTGDANVVRTLVFGGQQYTVGTRVQSELEVKHLQFGWAYQFINIHDGMFKLGTLLEVNGYLLKTNLTAASFNLSQNEDFSVGLPTAGFAMDINPHRMVSVYGQVAGMKAGSYGYSINSDAGIKFRPQKNVFLTAGYRTFNVDGESKPDFAHLQFHGPFVGAGVRF